MESSHYTLHDRKLRLIGIPLLGFLIPAVLHVDSLRQVNPAFLANWFVGICSTLIIWEGNRFIIVTMRRFYPGYNQTTRRLFLQAIIGLAFTFIATFLLDELICKRLLHKILAPFTGFRISLIPTVVVHLVYEAVYYFDAWKSNVRKTEALARESVQSQLEVLKNQLDPHFLFNSLNTLAALIDDENSDAQQYLERLSDVYRYVLVSRSKNMVPLSEEITFLDAYVYLNKIRFRENLQVEKQLAADAHRQYVTPLSLQMLIENAIKHNVVSKENPLKISIQQEQDGYLVIENNVQQKTILRNTDQEKSTRVGLQNIINRYSLLTDRQVEIIQRNGLFTVKLPLLTAH